jgi:DNA mismatch repair protein MutS
MQGESSLTPAMRQWQRVKDEHPDKIVLFRMGDFYEMFGDDARRASEVLDIALTTRERGKPDPMPMCGIPYHALEPYLAKLLQVGIKVALCDQVEDPAVAKGIVRREVTRVVTPGTVLEDGVVDGSAPVILAAWNPSIRAVGLVWADISSGDLVVWQSSAQEAEDRLKAVGPSELLLPESSARSLQPGSFVVTPLPDSAFDPSEARDKLAKWFGLPSGLPGLPPEPEPLGALLALMVYARDRGAKTMKRPRYEIPGNFLAMDEATRRNLELTVSMETGTRAGTLLACLDATLTPMGARLLREWTLSPCADREGILERQSSVGAWIANPEKLASLRAILRGFPDLARLVARFGAGIGSPRDAGALRVAMGRLPGLLTMCQSVGEALSHLQEALPVIEGWRDRLDRELEDRLPAHSREGGIFARGFHAELDRVRTLAENAHDAVLAVEAREREKTGIGSLKVKYNKIFGYFLEVSRANLGKVPAEYERRQTLVNAERFVTKELKELEAQILSARSERESLEAQLWERLVEELQPALAGLRDAAADVGRTDVLAGCAVLARERGYVRPEILDETRLEAVEARHPVLELDSRHRPFVPNPVAMDTEEHQITLLTGPNMGGKSTYLRQVALMTVMAQMGSYVAAKSASVGLVDRLFCRVGAGDSLLRGLSTFMVEMTETATILQGATVRSLVILDEVGRGTSTYDGLAIAWAVVEALRGPEGMGCRTLFATHFHELTELGRTLPGVRNLTMAVREYAGRVHFLRSVEEGAADKSYGIHVAELAGVPEAVVSRARQILMELEAGRESAGLFHQQEGHPRQGNLFEAPARAEEREIIEAIRSASPERMTPLEALLLIERLRSKLPR